MSSDDIKTMKTGTYGTITLTVTNGMLEFKDSLRPWQSKIIPLANIAIVRKHLGKAVIHANDGSTIVIATWKAGTVVDFISAASAS